MTAKDVRSHRAGAQVPEITTRGGSPQRLPRCQWLRRSPVALPSEGVLNDEVAVAEARRHLQAARLHRNTSRGGDDETLADAIKRFQAKAGMTPDGQITPSLLAVMRATKTQVAALPVPGKPGPQCLASARGPLEHEVGSTFKDCESCPDMVVMPAGRFRMGAAKGREGASGRRRSRSMR